MCFFVSFEDQLSEFCWVWRTPAQSLESSRFFFVGLAEHVFESCCFWRPFARSTSSRVLGSCDPLRNRGAEARSARQRRQVSVFQDSFVSCMSPSQRVLHVSQFLAQLSSKQDARDMHAVTNSCGFVHGVFMHDSSSGVHVNSCGAVEHRNSCHSHAAGVQGRTKTSSMML